MSKALDLATLVTGNFATTADVTNAIDGIVIPDGVKVLQVNRTNLASTVTTSNTAYATLMTGSTITLASASNSLLVDVSLSIDIKGNGATVTPEAYVELRDSAGVALDTHMIYHSDLAGSSSRLTSTVRLQALYSPSTTSETVTVHYKCDQGALEVNDSSSITITEIAA